MDVTNSPTNIIQRIECDFQGNNIANLANNSIKNIFLIIISYLNNKDNNNFSMTSKVFNKIVPKKMPFINLKNPESLKKYLGTSFKSKTHIDAALNIVKQIYESGKRGIKNSKYGQAFPMDPEIMAHAMQLAKDEIVMEIAGASGENGILLAFSDSKHVYVNDIERSEMQKFRELRSKLPKNIQNKLEPIEGNCFNILNKQSKLANKVGLILCRNLIHFFSDEEQAQFFNQVKQLLKPGGRAIFTANAIYSFELKYRDIFDKNPNSTCFTCTRCLVSDFNGSRGPCAELYCEVAPTSKKITNEILTSFTKSCLVDRSEDTNFIWQVNTAEVNKLEPELKNKINTAYNENKQLLSQIMNGNVYVLKNTLRLYSKKSLSDIFNNNGFEIELTFLTGEKGHLVTEADLNQEEKRAQIGIIVKKPNVIKPKF